MSPIVEWFLCRCFSALAQLHIYSIQVLVSCTPPQWPSCLVCRNRSCCQSQSDPTILQGSEVRGQWGDTGIVARYGLSQPGPITAPTGKQKAGTSFPGKLLDTSKVADVDFRSIAREPVSYNSLSYLGPERDAEDTWSFCYCCEKPSEGRPQSKVVSAFQCNGIWVTRLTLWRHPVTPGSVVSIENKEVGFCNVGSLKFCDYDRPQRGQRPGRSRRGGGWWRWCCLWCLRFRSSSEFLDSGMSKWDLFHMATKRQHTAPPPPHSHPPAPNSQRTRTMAPL